MVVRGRPKDHFGEASSPPARLGPRRRRALPSPQQKSKFLGFIKHALQSPCKSLHCKGRFRCAAGFRKEVIPEPTVPPVVSCQRSIEVSS